jgi:molybdenum cofactor cytidylyltransferase
VVLAAGASTRLGHPKQLATHEGEPLLRRAALAAVQAGARPVVVVLGAHAPQVAPALDGLDDVTVVVNAEWPTGLASSLGAGLRALGSASCDAALVTLADQPLVDAADLRRLLAAFGAPARVVAAEYDGTLGVPAIFGREHFAELLALTGDAGAGGWLRRHAGAVTAVPVPNASFDVDTAADLARLRSS